LLSYRIHGSIRKYRAGKAAMEMFENTGLESSNGNVRKYRAGKAAMEMFSLQGEITLKLLLH
jgi:hypothetical protein